MVHKILLIFVGTGDGLIYGHRVGQGTTLLVFTEVYRVPTPRPLHPSP